MPNYNTILAAYNNTSHIGADFEFSRMQHHIQKKAIRDQ